jgi:type IV pilus biogenesis protein CpaD/CtpE
MATVKTTSTAALLALALAGCSTAPRVEEHFGEAVRANLSAQVANPKAAPNVNPAAGIDGQAARASQERYERSFAQPDQRQESSLIATTGGK